VGAAFAAYVDGIDPEFRPEDAASIADEEFVGLLGGALEP
jgi:hypothetical protein